MSTEKIDVKTPSKLFEFEVRGFVVLRIDLHGTTLTELLAYEATLWLQITANEGTRLEC